MFLIAETLSADTYILMDMCKPLHAEKVLHSKVWFIKIAAACHFRQNIGEWKSLRKCCLGVSSVSWLMVGWSGNGKTDQGYVRNNNGVPLVCHELSQEAKKGGLQGLGVLEDFWSSWYIHGYQKDWSFCGCREEFGKAMEKDIWLTSIKFLQTIFQLRKGKQALF